MAKRRSDKPSAAALRMRRHRELKKAGLVCVWVPVDRNELEKRVGKFETDLAFAEYVERLLEDAIVNNTNVTLNE